MEDMKKILEELDKTLKGFSKDYPEQTGAFMELLEKTEKSGAPNMGALFFGGIWKKNSKLQYH